MKRIMWFFAMITVAVTSIVLQFMPDVIPMHHDLAGNTDRWGSKMESFIFPIAILFITLFWHILICVFEKKSVKANPEKEQLEAKSAAKVLSIVGLSQAVMFGIMHNDNTWRKSNLIGAICIICAGLLTIITSVFANGIISTILMLVYIILASVIAVIYFEKRI